MNRKILCNKLGIYITTLIVGMTIFAIAHLEALLWDLWLGLIWILLGFLMIIVSSIKMANISISLDYEAKKNQIPRENNLTLQEKLNQLDTLYNNQVISYDEYEEYRKKIIQKMVRSDLGL